MAIFKRRTKEDSVFLMDNDDLDQFLNEAEMESASDKPEVEKPVTVELSSDSSTPDVILDEEVINSDEATVDANVAESVASAEAAVEKVFHKDAVDMALTNIIFEEPELDCAEELIDETANVAEIQEDTTFENDEAALADELKDIGFSSVSDFMAACGSFFDMGQSEQDSDFEVDEQMQSIAAEFDAICLAAANKELQAGNIDFSGVVAEAAEKVVEESVVEETVEETAEEASVVEEAIAEPEVVEEAAEAVEEPVVADAEVVEEIADSQPMQSQSVVGRIRR